MKSRELFVIFLLGLVSGVAAKGGGGGGRGGGRSFSSSGSSKSSKSSRSRSKTDLTSNSDPNRGAPPAYPGLQNQPVAHSNQPPAYSPSHASPPGYKTLSFHQPSYGTQFGKSGLAKNTYIQNNYYGGGSNSASNFLTHALISSRGRYRGFSMGRRAHAGSGSSSNTWSERKDREWRATTQAPYFANKVPGGSRILPAAAVIGAATAFGLVSLLPLNVPIEKPLMHCNSTFIAQNPIRLGNYTYSCVDGGIAVSCPRTSVDGNNIDDCLAANMTLGCDLMEATDGVYCSNGTLLSNAAIVCDSSSKHRYTVVVNGTTFNETEDVVNCHFGELPEDQASFIPMMTFDALETTEKPLSFDIRMRNFFFRMFGRSEATEVSTVSPQLWIPEAMTFPPEPKIVSEPSFWAYKKSVRFANGTTGYRYDRVPDSNARTFEEMNSLHPGAVPSFVVKVPKSYFDITVRTPKIMESSKSSGFDSSGDDSEGTKKIEYTVESTVTPPDDLTVV